MTVVRPVLLSLAAMSACSRVCSTPATPGDAAGDAPVEASVATTRCTEEGPLLRIAAEDQDVEIGNGVVAGTQAAMGLTIGGHAKVILYFDGNTRSADLGAVDPDAPPPLVVADGADVLVAHAIKGSIVIDRVTEAAGPRPFASVVVGTGDDLDFDVAVQHGVGLVAWTFGTKIQTARIPAPDAGVLDSISKPSGDVTSPRVLPSKSGWWLAWVVTRMDADAAVKGAAPWWDNDVVAEGPADRVWPGWIELASLDADGRALGAAVAVTSHDGRITAFDWAPSASGLDFLGRDATASGEGASLLHIHAEGAAIPPPKILAEGMGPGAPVLFTENWAAFVDPGEGVHVLPLDSKDIREPALDGTQPLVAVPNGPKIRVVAVRVGAHGRGAELRIASCTR